MKLIIHPGHAKCGSTSIQNFLRVNRGKLFSSGYLVPDINFNFFDHPEVRHETESPRAFLEKIILGDDVGNFTEKLKSITGKYNHHTLIISAENLTNRISPGSNSYKIHQALKENFSEVTLIYYIKPQDNFILSSWQQWGYKKGLTLEEHTKQALAQHQPNYLNAVKCFENIFKKENIHVTPLNKKYLINQDLIMDFCSRSGIDTTELKVEVKEENKSLNPFICEELSKTPSLFKSPHDESVKRSLIEKVEDKSFLFKRHDSYLSVEKRKEIIKSFKKHNSYLHKNYFSHQDIEDIFQKHLEKISPYTKKTKENEKIKAKAAISKLNKNENKIKIVAIAKDEGAYLADWIYHHLYFGFDAIHIYVNRTKDKSYEILKKINEKYPNVTYDSIDWVDQLGSEAASHLQNICYSLALHESQKKQDCTHLLYIDIDEFWLPKNFSSSIHDCMRELNDPDVISFEWLIQVGEEHSFSPPPQNLNYQMASLVKTLFNINCSVKRMSVHKPLFTENVNHILANGEKFIPRNKRNQGGIIDSQRSFKNYTLMHRMYRSECEYIASLLRGNPENDFNIKLNRKSGYLTKGPTTKSFTISPQEYEEYLSKRKKYYKEIKVDKEISASQNLVKINSKKALKVIIVSLLEDEESTLKVLKGLKSESVSSVLKKTQKIINNAKLELSKLKEKNAGTLRDIAIKHENDKDYITAYYIMREAKKLRPNGPLINKKLTEYKKHITT
ncbi:glycosyltransferase family 92 protein [Oceanimonas smirnovii]|uniref:glycosyltransferase family 92 protein n=1 Tax=Oceanimonas smirnovii TaxID=264574 RepID=UPI003AAB8510